MFGTWTWTCLSPCGSSILEFLLQVKYHSIAVVRKKKHIVDAFLGLKLVLLTLTIYIYIISDLQPHMCRLNLQQIIREFGCICYLHLLKNHWNNIMDLSIYAFGPPTTKMTTPWPPKSNMTGWKNNHLKMYLLLKNGDFPVTCFFVSGGQISNNMADVTRRLT